MTPDGLTPADARLLWLAANTGWDASWVLAVLGPPRLSLADIHNVLSGWVREGWVVRFDTAGGVYYRPTASGRVVAARYTPALLHHAGACLPGCPLCEESA